VIGAFFCRSTRAVFSAVMNESCRCEPSAMSSVSTNTRCMVDAAVQGASSIASTSPPVTMSATPYRCPSPVAATSMTVLAVTCPVAALTATTFSVGVVT
jgi:hypothetical protein